MLDNPYVSVLAGLIAGAVVVRFSPTGRSSEPLDPVEVAFLRDGARAAAQTSLAELHLVGAVDATGGGRVVRKSVVPRGCSVLARAQYASLYGPSHPRRLQAKPRVQQALDELSRSLQRRGLVLAAWRWAILRVLLLAVPCVAAAQLAVGGVTPESAATAAGAIAAGTGLRLLPRRTAHGTAMLRRLRRDAQHQPQDTVLAVALGGATALRALLPRFTEDGGLLTKPSPESFGDAKIESRSASAGGNDLGGSF